MINKSEFYSTISKIVIKKIRYTVGVITLLVFIYSCNSQQPELLEGKWKLLQIEYEDSASGIWKTSDWMKNGTGTLVYKSNGNMTVEFLPENFGIDSNAEEYAYTASYKFDPTTGLSKHTRLTHTDPEEIGKKVTRKLEIKEDTLIMFADEFGLRLKWLAKR